jgi:hypothetical protein
MLMLAQSARDWAKDEFGEVKTGDSRWRARPLKVAARAARQPSGKVSEVFCDAAERQAQIQAGVWLTLGDDIHRLPPPSAIVSEFIVAYRPEPLARGDFRSAVRWVMRNRTVRIARLRLKRGGLCRDRAERELGQMR